MAKRNTPTLTLTPPPRPKIAPDEAARRVYDLSRRAVSAKQAMKTAARLGQTTDYHRAMRATPEVKYVAALVGVKKQLKAVAMERKRVQHASMPEAMRMLHVEQLDEATARVAEGALIWLDERLGRARNVGADDASMTAGEGEGETGAG